MALNYNHLYYFHVAAVEGTVASAAQRLGVRQPTVSEQLRSFERFLGFDLFERLQSGLRLTERGRVVFEHSSRMFSIGEKLIELVGLRTTLEASPRTLRIGVGAAIDRTTRTQLVMPICRLEDCVPIVRTAESVDLLRDLRAGLLDLVLCEIEPPAAARRELQSRRVGQTPLVAVAPPSVTNVAADWQDVGFAQYLSSIPYRWEVDAFLERRGLRPRVVIESDDSLLLVEVAIETGSVTIVPRPAAEHALQDGRLSVLEDVGATAAVHALYQDNVSAELAARAVEALVHASSSALDT